MISTNSMGNFADVPNRQIAALTLLFCFFTAAPLYDVPLVGISVTAPLAGWLVYSVLKYWQGLNLGHHVGFLQILSILYFALLLSWAFNVMDGSLVNFAGAAKTMTRYGFWFLIAMLACRLFSRTSLPDKAARAYSLAVVVMSVFVVAEFLVFGGLKSSGWSRLTTLSQNSYGVQYSTFLPFAYYAFFASRGRKRLLWGGGWR